MAEDSLSFLEKIIIIMITTTITVILLNKSTLVKRRRRKESGIKVMSLRWELHRQKLASVITTEHGLLISCLPYYDFCFSSSPPV